jgi:hypothetical protein
VALDALACQQYGRKKRKVPACTYTPKGANSGIPFVALLVGSLARVLFLLLWKKQEIQLVTLNVQYDIRDSWKYSPSKVDFDEYT